MSDYQVRFVCSDKQLSHILECVRGVVVQLHVEQVELAPAPEAAPAQKRKRRTLQPRNSRALKAALEWLKDHPKEFDATPRGPLGKVLEAAGFKAASASPLCTAMMRGGYIQRVGKGRAIASANNRLL